MRVKGDLPLEHGAILLSEWRTGRDGALIVKALDGIALRYAHANHSSVEAMRSLPPNERSVRSFLEGLMRFMFESEGFRAAGGEEYNKASNRLVRDSLLLHC